MRRTASIIMLALGGTFVALGSILPYGSDCPSCRVFFPGDTSLTVWLPSATEPLVVIAISIIFVIRLVRQPEPDRYVAGFLVATGLLTMARFLLYAIHVRFPTGGWIGWGGVVGVIGGALILAAGLTEHFSASRSKRSELSTLET